MDGTEGAPIHFHVCVGGVGSVAVVGRLHYTTLSRYERGRQRRHYLYTQTCRPSEKYACQSLRYMYSKAPDVYTKTPGLYIYTQTPGLLVVVVSGLNTDVHSLYANVRGLYTNIRDLYIVLSG